MWLGGWVQAQGQSKHFPNTDAVLLSSNINSGANSHAPFRHGAKVYFTAPFQVNSQQRVNRIFCAHPDEQGATMLSINPKKEGLHAANLTMTPNESLLFYTLCKDSTQNQCTIWSRKKRYEGGWEAPSKLPPHINQRNSTATQPAIGYDWNLKKYILYFASDRPGGKGGMDIWRSVIQLDGTYDNPEPMPFNTAGDEITPYFHLPEKTLFFSSNGHPGEGGFDVFSTINLADGKWDNPVNPGKILNSPYDETYFTFHAISKKGYFSSNRPVNGYGQGHSSPEAANIYEIGSVVDLTLPIFDANNGAIIHGATAVVFDETTMEQFVFKEGPFDLNLNFGLLPERVYRITVLSNGYEPFVMEVSTEGVAFPISLEQEVRLFLNEGVGDNEVKTFSPQPR